MLSLETSTTTPARKGFEKRKKASRTESVLKYITAISSDAALPIPSLGEFKDATSSSGMKGGVNGLYPGVSAGMPVREYLDWKWSCTTGGEEEISLDLIGKEAKEKRSLFPRG